jgi:lipid-binding SYLF domain-containing protein
MSIVTRLSPALFALAVVLAGPASGTTRDERRQDVRDIVHNTLEFLYKAQPHAKDAVAASAGYVVFGNFGMKIVPGGGQGSGIAVNRKSGQETFMKMTGIQAGPGAEGKKYGVVWVFETDAKFDEFVSKGLVLDAQAKAPAQVREPGAQLHAGAVLMSPGVWVYQLDGDGLARDFMVKGTKYRKAGGLNQK